MKKGSFWFSPEGEELHSEGLHEHWELLSDHTGMMSHEEAFSEGYLRAVVRGSEFVAQWAGTLTDSQKRACERLAVECNYFIFEDAAKGYDPENFSIPFDRDSRFHKLFNAELSKKRKRTE